MRRPLTDSYVAALKPEPGRQSEHADAKVAGLLLRVSPGGTKTWVMRYVAPNGQRRRMKLGTYPALKLADARLRALKSRTAIEEDRDPAQERREARRLSVTLDELAGEYWAAAAKGLHGGRGRPKRARTLAVERQRYEAHAAPIIGEQPFNKLKRADIRQLERQLSDGPLSNHSVAGVLGAVRSILALAVHDERLSMNPATGIIRTRSLEGRDRHWSLDGAKALYEAFQDESCELDPSMRRLQRFLALTLVRRDSARLATWGEIDIGQRVWMIPATRMKGGRPYVVPLSSAALACLGEPRGKHDLVFASPNLDKDGAEQPLSKDAPYVALRRMCKRLGIPEGGPHDWRRTGATLLTGEVAGVRRFVVSLLLSHNAHEGATVTALYDRNDYLADKRRALEIWAGLLTERR